MNVSPEYQDQSDVIDLRALALSIWLRRWWMVVSVVFFSCGFGAAAFLMTPVYRAATVLLPASSDRAGMNSVSSALGQLGGLASLAGVSVGSSDVGTEEALAVLRSRQFTERFINDLNLMPILFQDQWDEKTHRWVGSESGYPTIAKAYKRFQNDAFSISQDKKTGLLTLQVDWPDREKSALWANELVRKVNEEMKERAMAQAEMSLGYLEKELATTSEVNTRDAINRLIETQVKQRMLANVSQEYAFRVIDKAVAPDQDDPIRPQRLKLLLAGPFVGLLFGFALVVVLTAFQKKR